MSKIKPLVRALLLLVVGWSMAPLAGCGVRKEPTVGTETAKGVNGRYFYVNIFRPPVGGYIQSDIGGIRCGASSVGLTTSTPPQYAFTYYAGANACGTNGQTQIPWTSDGAAPRADGSNLTRVTLTATGEDGNAFLGWGGDCSGLGTCTLSPGADRSVVAVFGEAGSSHPNFSSPALHGPAYAAFLANAAGALQCTKCHGVSLKGQGIAPSCAACHAWPLPSPVIHSFAATPASVTVGQGATLSWSVTGATSLSIDQGVGAVTGTSIAVTPGVTTTYTLTATNPFGSSVATITLPVQAAPQPPTIASFTASPPSIAGGLSATLSWSVTGATSLSIDQGVGAVTGTSIAVTPGVTTTYTLTATNANGTTARTATVTVTAAACLTQGGFNPTGNLNIPREASTATLLQDGTVLVTGGTNTGGYAMASSETYDPSSGQFDLTGPMNTARIGHTATLLPGGKVLLAGGTQTWSTTPTFRTAELYDPVTRTFAYTGSLNVARYVHTATLLPSGKVLITGGDQYGYAPLQAELYDPATGLFTLTGSLSTGRAGPATALLGSGAVLVTAGYLYNVPQSSAELFSPSTGTFTATGPMNMARGGGLLLTPLPDGRLLVAGGQTTSGGSTTSAELFDPVTGTFSYTGSMADPRSNHVTIRLPGGKVLVAGGLEFQSGTFYSSAELYDATTGLFTLTSSMGVPRLNAGAVLLPDGSVLVAGGGNATGPLASAEVYTPPCAGITGIGAATILGSISNGANGWCWYGNQEHTVQTSTDGVTRVAAVEYRACDTRVDRLVVYTRASDGTWSTQVPFTYDYSAHPNANAWSVGMPGNVAGALDATGAMHVLTENRRYSTSGMAGYATTQGLVYAWGGPAAWQATETTVSDASIQTAAGNSSGVPYAGVTVGLAFDPGASLLRLLGNDGAWWATAYHVIETAAGPGNSPPWAPYGVVATSAGAVDRNAILGTAQDYSATAAVQVWVDGPTCRLKGREFVAGAWAQTIDVPLGYAGCSYQSSNYFGFFGHADVFLQGTDLDVVIFARSTTVAGQMDVLRLARVNGAWSVFPAWRTVSLNGDAPGKAFVDSAGKLYAIHLDAAGVLQLHDFAMDTEVALRVPTGGAVIRQADSALRSPAYVTWTERAGGIETLYAAPLLR